MTIDELIEDLGNLREEMPAGGDTEVTMTMQENWPLESSIRGVASCGEIDEEEEHGHGDKVTIVEGSQIGYGAKSVFEAV